MFGSGYRFETRKWFWLGNYSQAKVLVEAHVSSFPEDFVGWMDLFFLNLAEKKPEEAKRCFETAIKLNTNAYWELNGNSILSFQDIPNLTEEEIWELLDEGKK